MQTIDDIDRKILAILQKDGSLTASEVAERIGMSQSPCWRRINRMERAGIIEGRFIKINRKKLGFDIVIYAMISITEHGRHNLREFEQAVLSIPEVQAVQILLGDVDYRLRIVVPSLDDYEELLTERIMKLPGIQQVHSSVMISELKNSSELPL